MSVYECKVVEIRSVEVTYLVEADNKEDAIVLAESGETIMESKGTLLSVDDRYVPFEPIPWIEEEVDS